MAHYFSYLPNFDYVSRLPNAKIGDYVQIKNFFRRSKVFEEIFNNLVFFEKYTIVGDERPDTVAKNFYGDSTLDWVIFLSNNYINVQDEWPLSQVSFDKIMLEKYGTYENLYSGIHHVETKEIKDSQGRVILKEGITISPNWLSNGNFVTIPESFIQFLSFELFEDQGDLVPYATVITEKSFPDAREGDQIKIENVNDVAYNGIFTINQVISDNVFRFFLNQTPTEQFAILNNPIVELFRISTNENINLADGNFYYEYYDENLETTVFVNRNDFTEIITNYQFEVRKEEAKRNIYLLKPQYLNILLDDLENIMTYRTGSTQFVNRKLKRAEY